MKNRIPNRKNQITETYDVAVPIKTKDKIPNIELIKSETTKKYPNILTK